METQTVKQALMSASDSVLVTLEKAAMEAPDRRSLLPLGRGYHMSTMLVCQAGYNGFAYALNGRDLDRDEAAQAIEARIGTMTVEATR